MQSLLRVKNTGRLVKRILPPHIFDVPAERLIAAGRVVLCALLMLAVQLDPTPQTGHAIITHITLVYYCLFAALLIWRTGFRIPGFVESQLIHTAESRSFQS